MVEDPGEKASPGALRPLGLPRPLDVKTNERGWPGAVRMGHHWLAAEVVDRWRIDDEWWRAELLSRAYFSVMLDDGRSLTLFQDLVTGRWSRQSRS